MRLGCKTAVAVAPGRARCAVHPLQHRWSCARHPFIQHQQQQRPFSSCSSSSSSGNSKRNGASPVSTRAAAAAVAAPAASAAAAFAPDAALAVWGALSASAAAAAMLERTKLGSTISGPLLAMMIGCTLGLLGLLPSSAASGAYDFIWAGVMPAASALLVIETRDMTKLHTYGSRLLVAFGIGAVGMFLGALAGALAFKIPAAAAACILASWTGGAVNFMATAQALQLPASALPLTMAADNLAFCVVLAALISCPLRLVRRFIGPSAPTAAETAMAAADAPADLADHRPHAATTRKSGSSSPTKSPKGSRSPKRQAAGGADSSGADSSSSSSGGGGAVDSNGMFISDIQAALQRQVTVPARMSGKPIARDGSLLMTEEPAAATVWAAYQRSRQREVYGGFTNPAASNTAGSHGSSSSGFDSDSSSGSSSNGNGRGGATPSSTPLIDFEGSPVNSGSDIETTALGSFDQGPLARDGTPLFTAEPSPLSLQAAYARSRDTSHDGFDDEEGGHGRFDGDSGEGQRLTLQSAVCAVIGSAAVCWVARAFVDAVGAPHLFLLAVSVFALAASAAGSLKGRSVFAGASQLGAPLMGLFFSTIGAATSSAAGASMGALTPLLGFITVMTLVHWAVLLVGARALQLEPSTVLVASNALVGGPATAAGEEAV